MRALDLTRPYTTVIGRGATHKYVQDGVKFDARGQEIEAKGYPCRAVGCSFIAKTKAGRDSHERAKHPNLGSEPGEEEAHGLEKGGSPGE